MQGVASELHLHRNISASRSMRHKILIARCTCAWVGIQPSLYLTNMIFTAQMSIRRRAFAHWQVPEKSSSPRSSGINSTAELDADIDDMCECCLKHVDRPVRAYRIGPAGAFIAAKSSPQDVTPLQRTIAVIPLEARSNEPRHFAIGELIADAVIAQLSRTSGLRVISRLSSTAFRGRDLSTAEIESRFSANYVLSGTTSQVRESCWSAPNAWRRRRVRSLGLEGCMAHWTTCCRPKAN